jgi:hypothetical protein
VRVAHVDRLFETVEQFLQLIQLGLHSNTTSVATGRLLHQLRASRWRDRM